MYKKILGTSLIFFAILLSSCNNIHGLPNEQKIPLIKNESYIKPEDVDYQNLSYYDYSEAINAPEVVKKIDNKESFVLFTHSVTCESCLSIKNNLMKYICSTQYVITTLAYSEYINGEWVSNIDEIAYNLADRYPEFFKKTTDSSLANGVPYFYFFLQGEMIANTHIPSKCFKSYQYFKSFLNGYIKDKQ